MKCTAIMATLGLYIAFRISAPTLLIEFPALISIFSFSVYAPFILTGIFVRVRGCFILSIIYLAINTLLTVLFPWGSTLILEYRIAYYTTPLLVGFVTGYISETKHKLQTALREKEMLMREIHHRIKNNLNIISSMIYLQSMQIENKEERERYRTLQQRILSIGIVHDKLYLQKDFTICALRKYMTSLIENIKLMSVENTQTQINYTIGEYMLKTENAVVVGLITTELIINAIKHAGTDKKNLLIEIVFRESAPDRYELSVRDNGKGMEPYLDLSKTESIGLGIVYDLIVQAKGSYSIENNNGTIFRVFLPK